MGISRRARRRQRLLAKREQETDRRLARQTQRALEPASDFSVLHFGPGTIKAIQDRALQSVFRDALFPRMLVTPLDDTQLWPLHKSPRS